VPWDLDVTIARRHDGAARRRDRGRLGWRHRHPALAEEVADATIAQEAEDSWIADQVAAGHPARWPLPHERRVEGQVPGMAPDDVTTLDGIPSITAPTQSKSQRAYGWIKERIVRQSTRQGTGSCSNDRDLDMSVVPVREASASSRPGLVTFERNVGARVVVDDSTCRFSMQALAILENRDGPRRPAPRDDIRRARAVTS
jgi:hypothetical protein